jgi:hypothetical protein
MNALWSEVVESGEGDKSSFDKMSCCSCVNILLLQYYYML